MIDIGTLREAAANIDWSARELRLGVGELPEGNTSEVVQLAIRKIDAAIELLFDEADALERWPEEQEGA